MSGGSWNYAFRSVESVARMLEEDVWRDAQREPGKKYFSGVQTVARKAFAEKLKLVAEALRMIEWVDSNDNLPGDEVGPILAALTGSKPTGFDEWLASRPEKIRKVVEALPPWKHYTMKDTGQVVLIKSYGEESEDAGGGVSLVVIVLVDPRPRPVSKLLGHKPPFEVYGVPPDNLSERIETWPEPDDATDEEESAQEKENDDAKP